MSSETSKGSFFRQSGWMVFANLACGIFMFAVHPAYAPLMGDKQYGLFTALLAMLNVLIIPSIGLQTTLAQQTAAAISPEAQARLTGTVRALLKWTFLLWLAVAAVTAVFQKPLRDGLTITNPWAVWFVVLFALTSLWMPIFYGVVQGRQNFLWLGLAQILNGAGRFVAVGIIVIVFGGLATGAIGGALIGVTLATLLAAWHSRAVWAAREHLPIDWKSWLGDVAPLTLALGASQFIFSVDMILVRSIYGEEMTGFYGAAGMMGRGLVMFTAPLIAVMFPKIVRSVAQGKQSNVLLYTLAATAALVVAGAALCTMIGWALRQSVVSPGFGAGWIPAAIIHKLNSHPEGVKTLGRLMIWFSWCMAPLAIANVLLNNLLARRAYGITPYAILVVAAYVTAAVCFADVSGPMKPEGGSFLRIVKVLGVFNTIFLALTVYFTWRESSRTAQSQT